MLAPTGHGSEAVATRRLRIATVGVLVIATSILLNIAHLAIDRREWEAGAPVGCGLPRKNLSGDPTQDYFSDGITEEIISRLRASPGVKVISRTSVERYKNTTRIL